MYLFFLSQNIQLLIFCMDDLEYMTILFHFMFIFRYCNNSLLHTFLTFAWHGYDVTLTKVCNLLSSLLLNSILSVSSVNTLFAWLLNLSCDFNMILSFSKKFLQSSNLIVYFITHLFCFFSFLITTKIIY